MTQNEGFIPVKGGNVFWKSIGNSNNTPILTLHGCPGFSHNLLVEPFRRLSSGRKIYFYDQLGGGRSDRPDNLNLWTVERFIDELVSVRKNLSLDEIILWGGSWGTILGVDYLLTNPKGISAVILSSPCLSAKMWKADADRLRLKLPENIQRVLLEHEERGTTDSHEYEQAMWEYLKRFACLLDPIPQEVLDAFADLNKIIYNHMWGPSEFYPTGTLKDYDRTKDLHKIKYKTLFICGREDEATPESTLYYASLMQHATVKVIENASHSAFMERPDEYMNILNDFLIHNHL